MGKDQAIVLREVCKEYPRDQFRIPVLNNLSLELAEGEFLGVMGPSGSGKTTLLNLIAGLDRPSSGEVIVGGEDLARISEAAITRWRSHNVGFIFQLCNLIPVLTAFENVELPLLLTSLSRRQRREQGRTALRVVGLEGREDHYPRQLSGGREQRVAIARAIVTDPYLGSSTVNPSAMAAVLSSRSADSSVSHGSVAVAWISRTAASCTAS